MSSARRAGKRGRHGQSDATSVAGVATTALAGAGAALAQACEAAGFRDVLTVKPEHEENFVFKMVFTPEQQQAFAYDGVFYEGVTKWIDTSEAKIMFIYGNSDPWYSLRMHDTDNPNVKMFVSDTKPHTVRMMDFDEATMQEMGTFVSEAIPTQLSRGRFTHADSLPSRVFPCRHVLVRGVSLLGSIAHFFEVSAL